MPINSCSFNHAWKLAFGISISAAANPPATASLQIPLPGAPVFLPTNAKLESYEKSGYAAGNPSISRAL